ncbi:endonuclease/exonuclease/phosphatase family metal-dependent hydrolase [Kribbella sp. VKM Ac-2569]|uniref:endonuclease/exonuclease/phosphatase family protein n=1 Tax=Kribbella sp. VKM Ac-2569 TaxID=2512220 RepID=UPI0010E565BB|nr:endonuclease/exonuclease/phosphatase family protein [Kribbella sp. VKM Ac-2569]RZT19728.1 endonuclease/exonuclease/phosphatase family metal-dependent hydrolase [Kribbella sp. VKM Ac-2569]
MTRLTVASLNTRGVPLFSSNLRSRYIAIAEAFETSDADVVNLQEVLTYYHLQLLRRSMPSYRASFRPSAAGPAGGLVTFSRHPVTAATYRRFPSPSVSALPRITRLTASLKGVLTTTLPGLAILNAHLSANHDGDWSLTSRYHRLHQAQLTTLAQYVGTVEEPAVLTGDFNIARDSSLYRDFLGNSRLADAFGDDCPPTFHQAYLPPDRSPHCIDFVLLSGPTLTVESTHLEDSYPSDHLGLIVRLLV